MTTRTLDPELASIEPHLVERGFDLLHWFSASDVNRRLPPEHALPTFGQSAPLALLVANSKALWPVFVSHLRHRLSANARASEGDVLHEAILTLETPLDDYVTKSVHSALSSVNAATWVAFGHSAVPRVIPIQRYAAACGFASLGRNHLSLHPHFGPWIALRAVVVFDVASAQVPAPFATEPPMTSANCTDCSAPCLSTALNIPVSSKRLRRLPEERQLWIQQRLACPLGDGQSYSEEQIGFHYQPRTHPPPPK